MRWVLGYFYTKSEDELHLSESCVYFSVALYKNDVKKLEI